MTKLSLSILTTILLSNTAWADSTVSMIENNSLSKAALEIVKRDYQPKTGLETIPLPSSYLYYTHESEKNNSLFRGALAKQGVMVNIQINHESETNYSRYTYNLGDNNSLFQGAMSK